MLVSKHISVDCVIFGYEEETLKVLLVERAISDPQDDQGFLPDWTLTGNHVYENERVDEAAIRVVKNLTGVANLYLEQFKTFANPERLLATKDQIWLKYLGKDPNERVASIGFFALVATDKTTFREQDRKIRWFPIKEVDQLGFDHNEILIEALHALRNKMKHEPIGFELLPEKFTLTQLQTVYEEIFDTQFDKRNFRKKANRMKYLIPLQEKQTGVRHKPAQLYSFSRPVYEQTRKELFDFIV